MNPKRNARFLWSSRWKRAKRLTWRRFSLRGTNRFPIRNSEKRWKPVPRTGFHGSFGTGKLEMPKLRQDVDRISSFYFNHGYIRAKVGEPDIKVEGSVITITIPIEEGPQYKVGNVGLEGDFIIARSGNLHHPPGQERRDLQPRTGANRHPSIARCLCRRGLRFRRGRSPDRYQRQGPTGRHTL